MHAASERASTVEAMRVLLDAGADPDARARGDIFASTPGELAATQPGGPAAVRLILSYPGIRGNAPGDLPALLLKSAAAGGHPDTVEMLLDRGAEAHDPDFLFGHTALHEASAAGNIETMRVLLSRGAKPGYSKYDEPGFLSGEGERPLHEAIRHPAAVELLLKFGGDPNGRMLTGETILHHAASICAGESLRLLLEHGAKPNVQDEYGNTPLHDAVRRVASSQENDWLKQEWLASCENASTERAWYLDQCKSDVTSQFRDEFETLDECLQNIAALLRFGADPNVADIKIGSSGGVTPFELARQPEIRERLGPALIRMMEKASNGY